MKTLMARGRRKSTVSMLKKSQAMRPFARAARNSAHWRPVEFQVRAVDE
jgi:hypothetical protein